MVGKYLKNSFELYVVPKAASRGHESKDLTSRELNNKNEWKMAPTTSFTLCCHLRLVAGTLASYWFVWGAAWLLLSKAQVFSAEEG